MDCRPSRTDLLIVDEYCLFCNERVVRIDAYCLFPDQNKSLESSIILSNAIYVSGPLDFYCMCQRQAKSFTGTAPDDLSLGRSLTL